MVCQTVLFCRSEISKFWENNNNCKQLGIIARSVCRGLNFFDTFDTFDTKKTNNTGMVNRTDQNQSDWTIRVVRGNGAGFGQISTEWIPISLFMSTAALKTNDEESDLIWKI